MIYKLFVSKHLSKITNQQKELSAVEAKRDSCLFGSVENRTQTRQIQVRLDRCNPWNISEVNGFAAQWRAILIVALTQGLFCVSRKYTCLANHTIVQISTAEDDVVKYKCKHIINIWYALHSSCTIFSQKIE